MQTNIDTAEVEKFSALASRWWDPKGELRTLHEINGLRLDYIGENCKLGGLNVLDVGCGGGLLTEAMAAKGAGVTGIDASAEALGVARLHLIESGLEVTYEQATAEQFAENRHHSFDVVTCLEMLEHVPEPESVIEAIGRLVRPGGYVFFSTLNRNPKSYLFAVVAAEYLLRLIPRGTHDYSKFIRPSELARWARAAGLEIADLTGLHHNPATGRYWLGDNVDVNYLMCCRRPA